MPSSKCIRAERKRQIEKGSEQSRKDFFVKRTPNHINNNKSNAHENNSDNKSCSNGGLWNNNQMAYIMVPNQYRKKVTGHNHRLMLISF